MKRSILVLIAFTNVLLGPANAAPLSTAFTYQGRLTDGGQLANGTYDFQFRLFDAPTNGGQVQVVLGYPTVAVSNGLFTTGLDFGSNVFNGTTWWLEISLRPSGTFGDFTFLSPRQPLTPTPNALFSVNAALATTAATANGVVASAVSTAQLNTPGAPANGQVLSYNGQSLVWTNASTVAAAWTLNGNSGTTSGVNFLGTTDNQPLEIHVNRGRALRLEPNTNGAPNVIGGSPVNFVSSGVKGATIGGGGTTENFSPSSTNSVTADFGTIGGGLGNTSSQYATVGGGDSNYAPGQEATVGGGGLNAATGQRGTVGGGVQNRAEGDLATVGGGGLNIARGVKATVGGGLGNAASASGATVPGGYGNVAGGMCSFAAGDQAQALHQGTFVWADSSDLNFASTATNEFAVRATGGVRFVSGVDSNGVPVAGVSLPAGSGSWTTLSDQNSKTHFTKVNPRELLDRLAQLPIQSWNYKSQSESVRHIGPVAQDFYAAFHVGEDDKHIATVDADGVALAAIQGLNQKLEAELNHRDAEIRALRQQLTELKAAIGKQTTPTKGGSQ